MIKVLEDLDITGYGDSNSIQKLLMNEVEQIADFILSNYVKRTDVERIIIALNKAKNAPNNTDLVINLLCIKLKFKTLAIKTCKVIAFNKPVVARIKITAVVRRIANRVV